jgi:hypothetical protein
MNAFTTPPDILLSASTDMTKSTSQGFDPKLWARAEGGVVEEVDTVRNLSLSADLL